MKPGLADLIIRNVAECIGNIIFFSAMSKTLCKTKDREKLASKQSEANFECKRCGKKAKKEKFVCKPHKIGKD
jgi:tRNA(Ile2) C34 agmatinyltransferase TiaS